VNALPPAMEHIDVSIEELEALLERGRQEPLTEEAYRKLLAAIHTLAHAAELLERDKATLDSLRRLLCQKSTEKTEEVLRQAAAKLHLLGMAATERMLIPARRK
jgi:hypothetical protein